MRRGLDIPIPRCDCVSVWTCSSKGVELGDEFRSFTSCETIEVLYDYGGGIGVTYKQSMGVTWGDDLVGE